MIPEPLLRRCYTDDPDEFVAAVTAALPADVDATAEAREWHARQLAAVTAAVHAPNAPHAPGDYVPHRLGKGVQGGGRFAKIGDVGIPLLRDLLRGQGDARTEVHKLFGKKLRTNGGDGGWGRGDLNGPNITRWATEAFGPRPNGPDANAWDAGRRELGAYLAAQPLRNRTPQVPHSPDAPDWKGMPIGAEAHHRTPTGVDVWKKVDNDAWDLQGAAPGAERRLAAPPDGATAAAAERAARPHYDPAKAAQPGEFSPDRPARTAERARRPHYDPEKPAVVGEFSRDRTPKPKPAPADEMVDWGDRTPKHSLPTATRDLDTIGAAVPGRIADTITAGDGSRDAPFVTDSPETAAFLLGHDKHVQLQSADQVATLLDQLQQRVKLLKDTGADTPNFDLCKVTVPGTNLFCVESPRTDEFPDGIPRVKMPQLGGVPLPGSKAAAMELNDRGEVDLSEAFIEHLKAQGIAVTDRTVDASHLKASQIELNGTKIVGMMGALRDGKLPPGAIFVSSDNYVVDGHHRWAANVGAEYVDGQPMDMPTHTIDAPILDVLAMANAFALEMGIPQAGVGDMKTGGGDGGNDRADLFDGLHLAPEIAGAITGGSGTKADPFTTADPAAAAALLYHDKHVKLDTHPGQITVVLDEVRKMAQAIKDGGDKPPPFDLCKLTVPGTSLFCVESKGIPRAKMPQLSGTPLPGSPAADMPADSEGRVNLTEMFPEWLAKRGISVTPGRRKVKEMKATQNELDGGKVSGIMQGWRDVNARGIHRDPDAPEGVNRFLTADGEVIEGTQADRLAGLTDHLFVDRDGYVVDGHHRWAGAMGADVESDGDLDLEMDTMEIDDGVDIVEVIALANAFAAEMGIPQAAVGQETGDAIKKPDAPNAPDAPAAPQANDRPETPDTPPADTRPFVAADDFLARYGISKGSTVQARYHDDEKALIDVTKSDGTVQQVKVPWARLGLPEAPQSNDRVTSGIVFSTIKPSDVAHSIKDTDRTLGASYNPRSERLHELSTQNLLTRLQIADAMERNPPDAGTAQFLRDVQEASQEALRAKGITHVTLYRGVSEPNASDPFPHDTTGLSSWTTNPDIAAEYLGGNGTLFKAEVPVEQILSWDALGALRNPHADQPGAEVLVARDQSTSSRVRTGTFPFVASAPSAMTGTKADYDPWDLFSSPAPTAAGADAPAAAKLPPGAPDWSSLERPGDDLSKGGWGIGWTDGWTDWPQLQRNYSNDGLHATISRSRDGSYSGILWNGSSGGGRIEGDDPAQIQAALDRQARPLVDKLPPEKRYDPDFLVPPVHSFESAGNNADDNDLYRLAADQRRVEWRDREKPPPVEFPEKRARDLSYADPKGLYRGERTTRVGMKNETWLRKQFEQRAEQDPLWGREPMENYYNSGTFGPTDVGAALNELFGDNMPELDQWQMRGLRAVFEDWQASTLLPRSGGREPFKPVPRPAPPAPISGSDADSQPVERRAITDLLGGDRSPDHIREVLKRGDLTEQQRADLRLLLPDEPDDEGPVQAALSLAGRVLEDAHVARVEQARALASLYTGGGKGEPR